MTFDEPIKKRGYRYQPAMVWVVMMLCIWSLGGAVRAVTLKGTLNSPSQITRIWAVNRVRANPLAVSKAQKTAWVFAGKWDAATHQFSIPTVPAGHHYDLIVWNRQGRWEGVNMDYYRLYSPQRKFTRDDRNQIIRFISKIQRFTNYNEPLWIAADHGHATVVVEQIRSDHFYSGRHGSIIFRVAVWYFQRYFGGWQKVSNMGIVLTRWRGPADQIQNPWQYLPALGGIAVKKNGDYAPIHVTLPSKPNLHHGLDGAIPTGKSAK